MTISVKMAPPVPPTEEGEPGTFAPQGNASAGRDQGAPNGPRSWERPWSLDEIRREAGSWSLAGDAGLLNMLREFSQRMIARTHETEKEVDGLVHEAKLTGIRLSNVTNDFIMLANTQFVENRVYDEDVTQEPAAEEEKKPEQQEKTREQREAELVPKVTEALKYGIDVIDQAFEKLDTNAVDSESEDEDSSYKVDPILEPKDPYVTRALPCLIGSPRFLEDDNVGLMEDVTDEEAETDHGSISESDTEKKDEESETEYSDSEEERRGPATAKTRALAPDDSGSESDSTESDEDMFGKPKKTESEEEEDADESEEEKGEDEGAEKDMVRQPKAAPDFASELAARIGASLPRAPGKAGSDQEDDKYEGADEVSGTSGKPSVPKVEDSQSSKHKEQKGEGKGRHAPAADDEDSFFGRSGHADDDEDELFGKPGGLFSSSKGLFDDDEEDAGGGLFGSVEKSTTAKKSHPEPAGEDKSEEADTTGRQRAASSKKIPKGAVPIFGGKEDDLFTASIRSEDRPTERKATVGSTGSGGSTKASAKKSGGGGGLFDDDEDEDDLFSLAPKAPEKAAASAKKMPVAKADLFGEDNEEDDLFSSTSSSKPAAAPARQPEPPATQEDNKKPTIKETGKKLPAGAVPMFGAAGNPMVAALKKQKPDSDSEEEDKVEKSSRSSSMKSGDSVVKVSTSHTPSLATQASSLFADDDDDDLFAVKPTAENKSKAKTTPTDSKPKTTATEPPLKTKEDNSLFSGEKEEGKDIFSGKTKPDKPAAEVKKSEEKKPKSGSLFGADEDEDDLFAAVTKPKDSGKKKPAGGVALFGEANIFGKKNEKETEATKEEVPESTPIPPPPTTRSTPQKKLVSLFDAEEEEEQDLFGSTSTPSPAPTKPAASESRKDRSKSLFDDEDILFGTAEESPSVDIFSKSPPAPAQKPKAETVPAAQPAVVTVKKETPVPVSQVTAPTAAPKETPAAVIPGTTAAAGPKKETSAPSSFGRVRGVAAKPASTDLFADDEEEEDLFGVSSKKLAPKTLSIGGVTTAESSDSTAVEEESPKPAPEVAQEPAKPRKPAGAVSMFGGLDPAALLKKKPRTPSVDDEKDEKEEKSTDARKEEKHPPAVAEKPAREKPKVPDPLFGEYTHSDDLFGKPQPVIVTKPVPILAAKPQHPKVEVPSPPGFSESPAEPSPGEAPKTPQSPKPPLSPPSDTKPFKKPVGGVSLFGGLGSLAELKKRTASQSEDTSPLSETPSDVHSPLSPASSDDLFDEKPRAKVVSPSLNLPQASEGKISSLQKNLGLNPAALLPGASPPGRDKDPTGIDFDDPADVNTLQSAAKDRAKVISRRRPQSRKARKKAALMSGISFEDASSPTSPELPSISDAESTNSETKVRVTDLFGNHELFLEVPSAFKPPVKQAGRQEDAVSKVQPTGSGDLTKGESKPTAKPTLLTDSDDLFSVSKLKPKNQLDDIFGDSKPKPAADDLFGNVVPKVSLDSQKNGASTLSKDADEDDLFSSSSSKDGASSKTYSASSAKLSKPTAAVDDDDIFADSSINTKKEKKEKATEHDTKSAKAQTKSTEEDDIFATSAIPAAAERKRPKKAVTKDETLFQDDTDIFADLPAAKPKEVKKKKKTEKKPVEQKDIDDIFAETSPAAPKSKKKGTPAKGVSAKDSHDIFDDPLNLARK